MDNDSPFAGHASAAPLAPGRTMHVLYCDICHHVWKAPAASTKCINCIQVNPNTARSLVSYETGVPIT